MSASLIPRVSPAKQPAAEAVDSPRHVWIPIIAGALVLYVPAYLDIAATVFSGEGLTQQTICLALWSWTVWTQRAEFSLLETGESRSTVGWLLIGSGGVLYALGRSQEFFLFELGSQIPLFVGIVLVMLRRGAIWRLWFPVVLLLFLIPVPGSALDKILVPLKKLVSTIVAQLLYSAGLPIARDGVVLYVGRYQLLIADACSGLNSMIALTAVGLLYVYLARYRRFLPNAVLIAAITPIALLANILRVAALVLVTYYAGEDAGEQFHGYAAFAEVLVVFGAFLGLDRLLRIGQPRAVAIGRGLEK
jgi:exosortase B